MDVLIVNLDSTIPNLALHKIKVFHESRGDRVRQIRDEGTKVLPHPLFIDSFDKIYVSCVFRWNRHRCKKWKGIADIGGSGYSLTKNLPPKIERMRPKINLGFTTRGCIRKCSFCIVPQKEGGIREVGDIYDIWDGKAKKVILLDNNILALPKTFFKTCYQLKKENLQVDFNQGLDHRLLTDSICKQLFSLHIRCGKNSSMIRFAFDDIAYEPSVLKALEILKRNGLKEHQTRWYIYVGVKDTVESVLHRINLLRAEKQIVFLMRDHAISDNKEFKRMHRWTSAIAAFFQADYSQYNEKHGKRKKNMDLLTYKNRSQSTIPTICV